MGQAARWDDLPRALEVKLETWNSKLGVEQGNFPPLPRKHSQSRIPGLEFFRWVLPRKMKQPRLVLLREPIF